MTAESTMSAAAPWVDTRLQRGGRPWRKIHLDYHNMPAVGVVGEEFDADEFIGTLQAASVDAIVVFAKDMHGWFYYPAARSAAVHPGLRRDLLGEQVPACRHAGIAVHAYYCTTWDNLLAEEHPDWLVVKRDRTTYLPKFDQTPAWTALCLRNPDVIKLMLDDTADLVTRYDIDGVWYDMPFPINGECFCHLCLKALRADGLDPFDTAVQRSDKQMLWKEWQRKSADLIESLRPGCQVDQNNNTRIGLGERAPWMSNVDIEALPTGGWGYQYFPVDVRYARNFGVPVTGQTGRFVRSWADFGGLKHPDQLLTEVAGIVAQGAQVCIGDQAPPSGRLDPAVYATIGGSYRWLADREADLEGAAPVVEAAIVAAGPLLADPGRLAVPGLPIEKDVRWSTGVVGAANLLLSQRVQFDVVEPNADLSRYGLLLVPDHAEVDAELASRLQDHLKRGGAVIAVGSGLRLPDGQPWPEALSWSGRSPYSVPYLLPAVESQLDQFAYALYGGADRFQVEDAIVSATLGEPMFERTPQTFTSHSYAPYHRPTEDALAWHRGRFGGFGFDIGTDFLNTGFWVYGKLFGEVLDAVYPDRLVQSDLPEPVDVAITRRATADGPVTLLHLTPSFTDRRWGPRPESYIRQPKLRDITVSLRLDHPISKAQVVGPPGQTPVRLGSSGPRTEVAISALQDPVIIALT